MSKLQASLDALDQAKTNLQDTARTCIGGNDDVARQCLQRVSQVDELKTSIQQLDKKLDTHEAHEREAAHAATAVPAAPRTGVLADSEARNANQQ